MDILYSLILHFYNTPLNIFICSMHLHVEQIFLSKYYILDTILAAGDPAENKITPWLQWNLASNVVIQERY